MLRPVLDLLVLYNVPISKHLVALCWVWYLYCSYIGEVTWCRIFWWFYWSLNLSSCHSSYFFGQAWAPFCGSGCLSDIFGVLGINRLYTCHLFPVGWSLYSFRCNSTCSNRHFLIPGGTMRCSSHVTQGVCFHLPPFESLVVQSYP
jgi:hypothetical protein